MKRNSILALWLAAASAVGLAETALRLRDRAASRVRFQRERRTLERSWERFDPRSGWELKPGYVSDDVRVNSRGFRGPELEKGRTFRIVCLGGTDTFGPAGEENTYPHALRAALHRGVPGFCGAKSGALPMDPERPIEVVNAGVSGHSTYNMLFRINRILRLKPDFVVILAGPEDIYQEDITCYRDNRQPFSSFWHADARRNIRLHVWSLLLETAGYRGRKPFPLSYEPEEFVPFNFEYNLSRIIERIRKMGALVALLTVPTLIPDDTMRLTPEQIRKITLPEYLEGEDIDAFLAVLRSYDTIIRSVARETGALLIDTAAAFEHSDIPRENLFETSCGLTALGCRLLGETVASGLCAQGALE
jgi:hypothetical protein